jgi:RNA polymerase sigma-70 factor (ECF subfamily)
VERARADPEAFGVLYDLYVDRVHAFAYRRLGSRAEAEDATAETMARALSGLHRFSWQGGGFGAWLFRIARNLCADALRSRSRTVPLPPGEDGPQSAPSRGPEEAAIDEEIKAQVRELVAELPDLQREAVLLKYSGGLRNTEIAPAMGMTPTAVSSLLHRTTQKLRERLGDYHA